MSTADAVKKDRQRGGRPPAIGTLFAGIGFALARPRVWIPLTVLVFLMGLVMAYPVQDATQQTFGHVVGFDADQLARQVETVPAWWFQDQARLQGDARDASPLAPLLLLASLLGVLIAAGWMQSSLHGREEHGFASFLAGAGQQFFPFLRIWVITLASYALLTWIVYGLPGDWIKEQVWPSGDPNQAHSENHVRWLEWAFSLLYLLGALKIEIISDLARASMVDSGKRSAVLAYFRGVGFWMRRWMGCLALVGTGLLLELVLLAGFASAVKWAGLPLWALAWLLPAVRVILRGGRLAALAHYFQQCRLAAQKPAPAKPPRQRLVDEGSAWGANDA